MGDSLWLAVCPRRDSMAPLVAGMYVDADGLQAWAVALGARDSSVAEVWFYPLASEKVVTFKGPIFLALVKEHQEREMYARLKAKFEPGAAVDRGYVVPFGRTPEEVAGKVNADPDAPFTAVVVDGVVRLHQVVRGVSSLVVTPEAPPVAKAGPVPSYTVGPEEPAAPPAEEPSTDGVAFLASMARQLRPSLSEASCLLASAELYHRVAGYPTAWAAEVLANRAELIDAGSPGIRVGPDGYVTSAAVQEVGHD